MELTYILGASPCFCKLAKYLIREKGSRLLDLEKASHVISLEEELYVFSKRSYSHDSDQLTFWLNKFSENSDITQCLRFMYTGRFKEALTYLDNITSELKGKDGEV